MRKSDQTRIVDQIEIQLSHSPRTPTRRRKPMRSNLIATWELRVADFRVYYDADVALERVFVRAIGIKLRNRVTIGGEEVDLS